MKPLSIGMGGIAALLLCFCTSFAPIKNEWSPERSRVKPSVPVSRQVYYYWYLVSGDTYQGWWPTETEVNDLESEYQTEVDTNPSGGSPIAAAYVLYGVPHIIWPSVILYIHY